MPDAGDPKFPSNKMQSQTCGVSASCHVVDDRAEGVALGIIICLRDLNAANDKCHAIKRQDQAKSVAFKMVYWNTPVVQTRLAFDSTLLDTQSCMIENLYKVQLSLHLAGQGVTEVMTY